MYMYIYYIDRKRDDDAAQLRQKAMQLLEAREWVGFPVTNLVYHYHILGARFGGGPVCNHLYPCSTCQTELEQLQNRQKSEIENFILLNDKFRDEDNPPVIYYISMTWFKEWENFVRGKTNTPPGPIENSRISVTKNGQLSVKHNSDHGQLSKEMWQFLHGIYGGGPELSQKQSSTLQTGSSSVGNSSISQDKNSVSSPSQEKPVSSTQAESSNMSQSTNSINSMNQSPAISSTTEMESVETEESDGTKSQTDSSVKEAAAETTIATKL
ncbi:hypothetical protein KUTeg_021913 [Tegillarca granosa]|uniref:DUSP domain-containing protein n=1 Tax=Tegillarca granosa TaxID=220873 RepID=A0ABQ9E4Q0_TEGGR|nr:hypothetical protein KUTeg_021913 [Tegillarca granosa]